MYLRLGSKVAEEGGFLKVLRGQGGKYHVVYEKGLNVKPVTRWLVRKDLICWK